MIEVVKGVLGGSVAEASKQNGDGGGYGDLPGVGGGQRRPSVAVQNAHNRHRTPAVVIPHNSVPEAKEKGMLNAKPAKLGGSGVPMGAGVSCPVMRFQSPPTNVLSPVVTRA